MNTRLYIPSIFVVASVLIATIGMLGLSIPQNSFAQIDVTNNNNTSMNMTDNKMMKDYDKSKYMEYKDYKKINGTINIMDTMFQAISAKFNVSLTQAISTAEQAIGNNSYAMSATGQEKDGFMVYSIILGSPDMKFFKVLVDPGNGQVLYTKEMSMMEWMMMMHSGGMGGHDMDMKKNKMMMHDNYKKHNYNDRPGW